jgi:toxin secretion/phage lysis holin
MGFIAEIYEHATHSTLLILVVLAVICDTCFGIIRAIKEKKFNSNFGIDGALRKVGMLLSLTFLVIVDAVIQINLIGFIPAEIRTILGLQTVGVAEFFSILYLAYEIVSILKNMVLCGLPVKSIWNAVRKFLGKYTTELPDEDEIEKMTVKKG